MAFKIKKLKLSSVSRALQTTTGLATGGTGLADLSNLPHGGGGVVKDVVNIPKTALEETEEFITKDIGRGLGDLTDKLFGGEDKKDAGGADEILPLPKREDIISGIFKNQANLLRRRRMSSTTKTSARGVLEGPPTASVSLLGV